MEFVNNYLFALIDGGGTVPPELGVARRLVDRGHHVTVLADEPMSEQVRDTRAEFIRWTVSWGQFQDAHLSTPFSLLRGMADNMFIGPAATQATDTAAAIERIRPDLVLTSFSAVGAMVAAEACDVPFDVLLPNVYALPASGMPPFGAGLRPARGTLGRLRDRVARSASTILFDCYTLAPLNMLRSRYGLDAIAHSWDQLHHARLELVLTSVAFDFPATLPRNARYVGPILDDPRWASDDSWSPPAGNTPLILVALSSTFQNQSQCVQRIVDALGMLAVRGLVTVGPALSTDAIRVPANVTVVASAPHNQVLRHASLVVTHGGHGTVMKALAAGLPLVILPHGRDQADNAVRVTTRGAGATLSRRASPRKVARAITEVLADQAYRHAAQQLGLSILHDVEGNRLMTELELLATV